MIRLIACLLMLSFTATAQKDSVSVKYSYGSDNQEVLDLYRFMEIHVNSFKILNKEQRNFYCKLSYQVFEKGVPKKEVVLNSAEPLRHYFTCKKTDSIYKIKSMAHQVGADSMEVQFDMGGVQIRESRPILKVTNSYIMKSLLNTDNSYIGKIAMDQKTPFLSFLSPFVSPDQPGAGSYCAVSPAVPPEQWHEKYKLDYYIIFYLTFIPS